MSVETTRDDEKGLTTHVVKGPISEAEMYRALEAFYRGEPTRLTLWDLSQSELVHITREMLRQFIRRAAKLGAARKGGRTAIVAPEDAQYGLGRMSEVYAEIEGAPFSLRVFRSREDALAWLTSDDSG